MVRFRSRLHLQIPKGIVSDRSKAPAQGKRDGARSGRAAEQKLVVSVPPRTRRRPTPSRRARRSPPRLRRSAPIAVDRRPRMCLAGRRWQSWGPGNALFSIKNQNSRGKCACVRRESIAVSIISRPWARERLTTRPMLTQPSYCCGMKAQQHPHKRMVECPKTRLARATQRFGRALHC
jgi:hypothetical protein